MKDHMDADIHLQPVKETHTRAVGCPKEAVTLWEACVGAVLTGSCRHRERGAHTGERFLVGLVTLCDPTPEQAVPDGLHLWKSDTHCSSSWRTVVPMRCAHTGEIYRETCWNTWDTCWHTRKTSLPEHWEKKCVMN